MSKVKDKKKKSGIQKHKVPQTHLAHSKQHLLKAAKVEDLKEKKKKKKPVEAEDIGVLDRFKKKPQK
jgi:hypothetical protein